MMTEEERQVAEKYWLEGYYAGTGPHSSMRAPHWDYVHNPYNKHNFYKGMDKPVTVTPHLSVKDQDRPQEEVPLP